MHILFPFLCLYGQDSEGRPEIGLTERGNNVSCSWLESNLSCFDAYPFYGYLYICLFSDS